MESYHNAMTGKYERVVLERRVLDRPLAAVTRRRHARGVRGRRARRDPQPRAARGRSQARLERREQALVLLNRRGFATAVFCRQCAGTIDCPNCSVSLVVHGEGNARRARCHYCNSLVARAAGVSAVRRAVSRAGRLRHRTGRGRGAEGVPRRARRAARSRRDPQEGLADVAAVAVPRRRDRRARRHADDCQGPRLSARHAGRRRVGRRRPRHGRLPRLRADVSAADPGRRPRRPRRAAGRSDRPDASIRITTASSSPAGRTTRRSTSASCSSAARCAIRRWSR